MSGAVEYLVTDAAIDKDRIVVTGHGLAVRIHGKMGQFKALSRLAVIGAGTDY